MEISHFETLSKLHFKTQRKRLAKMIADEEAKARSDELKVLEMQASCFKSAEAQSLKNPALDATNTPFEDHTMQFFFNVVTETVSTPDSLFRWKMKDYKSGRLMVDANCHLC
jgi:hypothetical protein